MLKKSLTIFFGVLILGVYNLSYAQEVHEDYQGTYSAKVINVVSQEERDIGWNDTKSLYKVLEVKLLDGPQKGQTVTFESDFPEIGKGDKFFLNYLIDVGGVEKYVITNINRTNQIYFFVALFVAVILFFGGKQGVRSLLALIGSFLAIFYILIPAILNGWHPLLACVLVASGILFAAIFFTHGFNRESVVAYVGTMIAVFITSLLAIIAVNVTKLSGFSEEASIYLNFNTGGTLDFSGLLLGAIIIGVLGVLDDIAVTQSAVVTELFDSNKNITRPEVYKRAMRVGKEHVGALVNTLVLAYTGTALPLLLLFSIYEYKFSTVINMEIFATEIIRTVVGSIGLVLTVPIVTLLAVIYLKDYKPKHHHSHSHGHSH
jgi:uncharacterized membrane protein